MRQEILNLQPVAFNDRCMKKCTEDNLKDIKFVEDMFYQYYLYGLNLLHQAAERSSGSIVESAVTNDMYLHLMYFRSFAAKSQPVEDALALKYNWEVSLDRLRKLEFLYRKFNPLITDPSPCKGKFWSPDSNKVFTMENVYTTASEILSNRERLYEFLKLDHNYQSRYILHSFDVRGVLLSAEGYTIKSMSRTKYLWSLETYGAYALAMLDALKASSYMKQCDLVINGVPSYELELNRAIAYLNGYLDNFSYYWWSMANDLIHQ